MMKKMTALLLALLMLALPVFGTAATMDELMDAAAADGKASRTEMTFVPGDLSMLLGAEYQTIYSDVLSALGLNVYSCGKEGKIAVTLQGNEVLTAAAALDDAKTFYLNSNVLGKDAVAVAVNEWQPLMEKLVDLMTAAEAFTEAEAAELKAQLVSMFSSGALNAPSEEEAFATVDWSALETLLADLAKGAVTEAVTEQPANCDKAVTKVTLTLKAEDIVQLYTSVADSLKADANAMAYLNAQFAGMDMTAAEFLDTMVAAVADASVSMEDMPVTYYVSVAGNVVRMDATVNMDMDGEKASVPVTYTRETVDAGVMHTVSLTADADGAKLMDISGMYLDAGDASLVTGVITMDMGDGDKLVIKGDGVFDDKNADLSLNIQMVTYGEEQNIAMTLVSSETDTSTDVKFNMDVTAEGQTVGIGVAVQDEQTPGETAASGKGSAQLSVKASGVTMALVGDYTAVAETTSEGAKKDTTCDVKLSVLGMEIPLLTVKAATQICDAEASIVSADAVHPASMTDEELEAWGAAVAQNAQIALITVVQNLPASVLQLMMAQ